jgi:AAA15 family ATPase/GTPase
LPEKAKVFTGNIVAQTGKKVSQQEIRCTSLDTGFPGVSLKKEIQYIPSFGHLRYDLLQNIVENPEYKKLAIDILKQFDNKIADICYTKADDGSFIETIITETGANMPFSVYGDGIKKILYILNKLFDSMDSVLLIDEIETGLHKKYYDILFPVIFALANKLNVQLFIATHSVEAIDAILKYGDYDKREEKEDPIKVITLKRIESKDGKESNIVARNVTGNYVYENRKVFEYEVRL